MPLTDQAKTLHEEGVQRLEELRRTALHNQDQHDNQGRSREEFETEFQLR